MQEKNINKIYNYINKNCKNYIKTLDKCLKDEISIEIIQKCEKQFENLGNCVINLKNN